MLLLILLEPKNEERDTEPEPKMGEKKGRQARGRAKKQPDLSLVISRIEVHYKPPKALGNRARGNRACRMSAPKLEVKQQQVFYYYEGKSQYVIFTV